MKNIVGLDNNNLLSSDYVIDQESGKTQSEINASLVQADNLKNGYFVLPGGLKMCWGIEAFTESEKAITFPIKFDSVPKVFTNIRGSQQYDGKYLLTSTATAHTTSGFTATKRYYNTEQKLFGNAGEPLDWFAIGY